MTNGCYMCQSLLMQLGSVATATLATDSRYGDIWVSPLFVCTVCITCNVCYLTPNFCAGFFSPFPQDLRFTYTHATSSEQWSIVQRVHVHAAHGCCPQEKESQRHISTSCACNDATFTHHEESLHFVMMAANFDADVALDVSSSS